MTLLRDLITIQSSVSDADFVVQATATADLVKYVVTDDLQRNFDEALSVIGHAIANRRSEARFLHGSFGSGKSHFMAVLREVIAHNPDARAVRGLAEPITKADTWLAGKKILSLTFHMLDARTVDQAVLEGYLRQVTAKHPDFDPPAVHRSDKLLEDAARLRADMGDEKFFARLQGRATGATGGLAAMRAYVRRWTPESYEEAAAAQPGTEERDALVSALTAAYFTGAVLSGEYLDLDTGLGVITRHAKQLGYDAMVLFLDELILWLSTKMSDQTFVQTEGAKLNKLVESADAARPLPIVSFVAKQRNLEEFLGPQAGGTEREALAHIMRSVQGRLGEIVLADTNLPEITEKRLLKPVDDRARQTIDDAFAAIRGRREIWDALLLGAQYGDAGIGSDAATFRKLYPFSPALVATLVTLSQALQRERTALKVMTELLVDRRDTLRVNDLIGVAALFEPLVLRSQLPDRPQLKQQFAAARETYLRKLRPLLLARYGITDSEADAHQEFGLDDRLVKTLLLGALVPEVPALHNLTAAKLHALNFGSITSPIPGYENQIVLDRMRKLEADAGVLHLSDGPDPVISIKLSSVDYDRLLEYVPHNETAAGVLQQLVRELVCNELGLASAEGTFGEFSHPRDWRGRRHYVQVRFGNVRDKDTLPDSALIADGETWRIVIDYPFDPGHRRNEDFARIETLPRPSRTVFWMPLFLTADVMGRVAQLAKVNYLLGNGGTGDRLNTLAADWSFADRQHGKVYLQQRQQQLRATLLNALKQAYGAAKAEADDVEIDSYGVMHTLAEGLHLGDRRGGTLKDAFENLTGELLSWVYAGKPALPDDEKPVTRGEMEKVLKYAQQAAADPTRGVMVETADRRSIQRICNPLGLGELAEHRYVLAGSTCRWSQMLVPAAAKRGYTDYFPVHVLRELIDEPRAHGFDRGMQNLILAVFALERQLAWYQHDVKVAVDTVQAVSDQMELRHPPMPDEDSWAKAVLHAQKFLGQPVRPHRSPSNLADLAGTIRSVARQHATAAAELVESLLRHRAVLGIDDTAPTGRFSTARRVAKLLGNLAAETDDVVVVELLARADLGEVDLAAAGTAFTKAGAVTSALSSAQWWLLEAMQERVGVDERALVILDSLQKAANHEQNASDLVAALMLATGQAAKIITAPTPPPPTPTPRPEAHETEVVDRAAAEAVAAEIRAEIDAGHRVRVTWERL